MSLSRVELPSQAATEHLAARIARAMRRGDAILLSGAIGAGKSTLVRALLRAATGDPLLDVPSPTFTLVQSYQLPDGMDVHHFDLWRLSGPDGLVELGWEDALRDIVLVEWPERLGHLRPPGALEIEISLISEVARLATLTGWPGRPISAP